MMSYKFSMNERQGSESISTRKSYLEPVTHYIEHPSESPHMVQTGVTTRICLLLVARKECLYL